MWKVKEENKLKEIYPNKTNKEISKILNKTISSINNKSYRLGLKKSKEFLLWRNKSGHKSKVLKGTSRDLTYDKLKKIANNYKTKIEFIKNDEPAYQACVRKKILDDVCSHMSVIKYSTPQLILEDIMNKLLNKKGSYNNRKIIKPYEIDLYYKEFKLGFEYQGIYWHSLDNNDKIKEEKCKEQNILLINIYEKTRNYEKDIKEQIIDNLKLINEVTKNNFNCKNINNIIVSNIYNKLYNKKELIGVAKQYNSFKEFKNNELKVYRKLLNLNLVDVATSHMCDKRKFIKLTNNEIKKIISKYNSLTEFRKNEIKLYKHIKKTEKNHLLKF